MAVTLCKSMFPSFRLYSSTTYAQFWDMVTYFSLLVEFTCLAHQLQSLYNWSNHVSIRPWLSSMKALTFVLNVVCKTLYTSDFVELLWESSKLILWLYWLLFQDSPFALIIKDIWKHFVYWSIFYFKPSLLHTSIQWFFTNSYEINSPSGCVIHWMDLWLISNSNDFIII